MASQITYVGPTNEKAVELINSHFARSFSIGTNWNKLRVAIRLTGTRTPALTLTGTPRFFVGVCHGTSSVYGDSYVSHSVGVISTSSTWGYQAGTPPYYYSLAPCGCQISESSLQTSPTSVDNINQSVLPTVTENSGSVQSLMFVDLDKNNTSNSISCSVFHRVANIEATTYTRTEFYFYAEQTVPALTNYSYITSNQLGAKFPRDEGLYGELDSVCVSWDRTVPRINILDIAVYKIS
jgi:hypothetical protein